MPTGEYFSRSTHPRVEIGPSDVAEFDGKDVVKFTRADGSVAAMVAQYEVPSISSEALQISICDSSGTPIGNNVYVDDVRGFGVMAMEGGGWIYADVTDVDSSLRLGTGGKIVARNSPSTSEGAAGTLRDLERARVPVTFNGTASKDTTYTFVVNFGQRPVTFATCSEGGTPLGNFYSQVLSAGATSCVVRLRDVDGTARTGSTNADLLAVL